jgi:hypothetical protein
LRSAQFDGISTSDPALLWRRDGQPISPLTPAHELPRPSISASVAPCPGYPKTTPRLGLAGRPGNYGNGRCPFMAIQSQPAWLLSPMHPLQNDRDSMPGMRRLARHP